MKSLIFLFFITFTSPLFSQPIPLELQKLQRTYKNEINKLNGKYITSLKKLRKKYLTQGKTNLAMLVHEELRLHSHNENPPPLLTQEASISVDPNTKIEVAKLEDGTMRLYHHNEVPITVLNKSARGWNFTKVGQGNTPKYTVTFNKNTTIYVGSMETFRTKTGSVSKSRVENPIASPWYDHMKWHKVQGRSGHKFICSGYECMIIAQSITVIE